MKHVKEHWQKANALLFQKGTILCYNDRRKRVSTVLYTVWYESPIGKLLLAEHDEKLVGAWMENQKYFLGALRSHARTEADTPLLRKTAQWLDHYFAGERPAIDDLPIAPQGTAFQKEVWQILCTIPYGQTMRYGEIAQSIATRRAVERMSAQAVGGAVGHNPLTVIIPCHRVVGSNGKLTGYAGGIDRKIALLKHEGILRGGDEYGMERR